MLEYQERVVREKEDLDQKLTSLRSFLNSDWFNELDWAEKDRLRTQCAVMGVYSEILGQRIAAFQRESDYLPDSVKLVDPDVDYEIHLSEKFVRDADGTLWCRKCGEQAEGLLPGGERDTLSDGYPFCENCVFSDPDNDPTLNIPLSEEEEKEWLR